MKEIVIKEDDEEAKKKIQAALDKGFWKLASISNCGVEKGSVRYTFLPLDWNTFTNDSEDIKSFEEMELDMKHQTIEEYLNEKTL